jgi:hypothetical protein
VQALGCGQFAAVHGISKRNLLALEPDHPPLVGTEALDDMIARVGAGTRFDAAVVAWDVLPRWDDLPAPCRWQEQVRLYTYLAESEALPVEWRENARARLTDYANRSQPSDRAAGPTLSRGAILPLCMDPEFESALVGSEAAIKRVLGVTGPVRDWPTGWGRPGVRSEDLLRKAIVAVSRHRRDCDGWRTVRGLWRDKKNEWDEYLVRGLLNDEPGRRLLLQHPILTRLAEVAP